MVKKLMIGAVALIAAGAAVAYVQRHEITLAMIEKVASKRMQDPIAALSDGLHVGLCGTGSPFPDPIGQRPALWSSQAKHVLYSMQAAQPQNRFPPWDSPPVNSRACLLRIFTRTTLTVLAKYS